MLLDALPEIGMIEDDGLRGKVISVYLAAMERGGWEDLHDVPFTLLIPDLERDLVDHTRTVTRMAMAVADARIDLDRDTVIAGALLHDVGKLLEYRPGPERRKSHFGQLVRHPVSGAGLAMEYGLPDEVVHIIAAHSKEGEAVGR
ncbi:MAG TPA: HDIG domain-containing protein, partial [Thermoplasmata archaeon]|nr:HDIG domain-containing protein [Thermoplasmata archaeon]